MAELPAVNASPLIYLAGAGLIDFLRLVAAQIVVPRAVANEIERAGPSDVTVQALHRTSWLLVKNTPPVPPIIQSWGLGQGESSVLAWTHEHLGAEAIIDDLAARRCAASLGIPVRGTLGLVLVAKRRGNIASARAVLEEMRRSGMYLSDAVMNSALALVGE